MKVNEILSKEEMSELFKLSDLYGIFSVLTTYFMIILSFVLVAYFPTWWAIFIALFLLGGRHLALAILMHDASHYSLFKTKWANDFVGKWFLSYPTWQDIRRYRPHHLRHHKYAGTDQDPDIDLVTGYPTTKSSLIRKFLRDLFFITGLKRIIGLILMDCGYFHYTVSSKLVKETPQSLIKYFKNFIINTHGVIITNLILFFILKAFHHANLYWLWIVSYLTFFSVFVRIRSIAEHAMTEMNIDPMKSTRTTYANFIARITVAPHFVNYHLEHHLLMTVPHQNFKKMHFLLKAKGLYKKAFLEKNYIDVLKKAIVSTSSKQV